MKNPELCDFCNRTREVLDKLKVHLIVGPKQSDGTIPYVCGECIVKERNKMIEDGIIRIGKDGKRIKE